MPLVTFLQVSDLHLGAPFGWLPRERRSERRREQQRALEAAVEHAITRDAAAILIPGDLFDREGIDAETLTFALHAFRVTGCPPVFIAPGNHDPWSESSPTWSLRLLEARGTGWPDHVHIFTQATWTSAPLPGHPVRIWGRCFSAGVASTERPLASDDLPAEAKATGDEIHIALLHGTHEGRCPPWQKMAGPFSEEEVRRSPFAYLAVGHLHARSEMEAADGEPARGIRLAYAGSAIALESNELGSHGALEVRIDIGARPPRTTIEPVPLDKRRALEIAVDLSGASSADQIDRRILTALDEARATVDDLAVIRLSGRLTRGVRYGGPGSDLDRRAYHVRVDTRRVRPDYNLETYRSEAATTTEARFVQALLQKLDKETEPEARRLVERALYYGLDAFRLREVQPAWEELGE